MEEIAAPLPALVSVTDETGEARYPSFKAIMAGKKKKITTWTLADLGIDATQVGHGRGRDRGPVRQPPRPPRQAGSVVTDDGDGAARIADFLVAQKLL